MDSLNNFVYLLILGAVFLLSACEKVIEVDLEETDQQIVIEASLQEGNKVFSVFVSKTAPYFDNQVPERIDEAQVILSDDRGNSWEIPGLGNGIYSTTVEAKANSTYTLQVTIGTVQYEARSFLPEQIPLLEIYTEYQAPFAGFDEGYLVYFRYNDPAGIANYYRAIHSLNGQLQLDGDDLQVFDDVLNDGSNARFPLFQKIFDPGDEVQVELIHFDAASYDYFSSLSDIVGDGGGPRGGSAAPGNPNSNWSGEALGYFSAYSSDTLTVVVPE